MQDYEKMLNELVAGRVATLTITREQFLQLREVLIKHEKFKHFRGEAHQGATISYTYIAEARA